LRLGERPHGGKLILRADALAAVAAADPLGFAPPDEPNQARGDNGVTALWLGPDEWLLATPPGAQEELARRLADTLAGRHAALVDISDARTVVRVEGPRARDLLAKACPLDLHPRVFGLDAVAQSLVGKAGVILHRVGEDVFDLYVLRSFALHLWQMLEEGAGEWGYEIG
jgi:sarcosine oxidase, subunit gamma